MTPSFGRLLLLNSAGALISAFLFTVFLWLWIRSKGGIEL